MSGILYTRLVVNREGLEDVVVVVVVVVVLVVVVVVVLVMLTMKTKTKFFFYDNDMAKHKAMRRYAIPDAVLEEKPMQC